MELEIKLLTPREKLAFYKAVPSNLQSNPMWMATATAAAIVRSIDGVPQPMPTNEKQIEELVERLGDDGLDQAMAALEAEGRRKLDAAKN